MENNVIFNPNKGDFDYKKPTESEQQTKIGKLITKLSGGTIKNQNQINVVLIFVIIISLVLTAMILFI